MKPVNGLDFSTFEVMRELFMIIEGVLCPLKENRVNIGVDICNVGLYFHDHRL